MKNILLITLLSPVALLSQTLNHQNAIIGKAERHLQFKVTDAQKDVFEIGNSTALDNQFQPTLWAHKESSSGPVFVLSGNITSAVDFGTVPIINLVAGKDIFDNNAPYSSQFPWGNGGTTMPIQTRPIFAISNAYSNYLTIAANGNLGIGTNKPQSKLHNVGSVRFESLPMSTRSGKCGLLIHPITGDVTSDCSNIKARNMDDSENTKPVLNALDIITKMDGVEQESNKGKTAFINTNRLEKTTQTQFENSEELIPYLLEAIKELHAKIDDLENQINSTKSNLKVSKELFMKLYPNPVENDLNLFFEKSAGDLMQVKIYDQSGIIALNLKEKTQNKKITIPVNHLTSGLYFYEIQDNNGQLTRGKFIKQ